MSRLAWLQIWLIGCVMLAQTAMAQPRPPEELSRRQRQLMDEHLPLGPPDRGPWIVREGYVLSYNIPRQMPRWVAYHIRPEFLRTAEPATLMRDDDVPAAPLPEALRPVNHAAVRLAPLEVMRRVDPRRQALVINDANRMGNVTFLLENGLGAENGLWHTLQTWIQRDLVEETNTNVWVIAGCVPGRQVRVPPMVFQIVYRPRRGGEAEAIAILLPQQDESRGQLFDFVVPVQVIQELTGLTFFRQLPNRQVAWEQMLRAQANVREDFSPRMRLPSVAPAEDVATDEAAPTAEEEAGADEPAPPDLAPPELGPFELAPAEPAPTETIPAEDTAPFRIVDIYYGTDRRANEPLRATGKITDPAAIRDYYGADAGSPHKLHLGICRISVPIRRAIGTIPRPGLFESPDRVRHFMLAELELLEQQAFRLKLQQALDQFGDRKQAFVYIHGFNNSFEDAAFRAAQMFVDLQVNCVPTMYTWPSRGSAAKYREDSKQVDFAIPHLQEFLRIIARDTDADMIHLIAHSMGTRLLTSALASLPKGDDGDLPHINQIILAAPDIDAHDFISKIAPNIERFGERITIYQSHRDQALYLSQFVMNDPAVPRLGLRPIDLSSLENDAKFNQVDATWVADSDIGHTYFGNTSNVIDDVQLVLAGEDVKKRLMLPSYIMRGKVEPWQQPPTPWYWKWWKLLLGMGLGALAVRLVRPRARQAAD